MRLLELNDVTIHFGGLRAVDSVDLYLDEGEILALIGPNGAGKSTVFNLITGIYAPTRGAITFAGENINGLPPYDITARGIARTFQNIRLFANLTVLDNVKIGCHTRTRASFWGALFAPPAVKAEERAITAAARNALEIVGLAGKQHEMAKNLAYGEQRRLEIARALATRPRLLLLDEPAAGMNPQEKQALSDMIRELRRRNLTILLVEHDMKFVMNLSDRVAVMDYGRKIADGTPREIQRNPRVIAAYLGKEVV